MVTDINMARSALKIVFIVLPIRNILLSRLLVGMFPLWVFTLGKVIMDEAEFTIPFQNILGSLVGILVPVVIGIVLQKKKPTIAKKVAKIAKPMLFIFLIFLLTFGTYVNFFMYRLFHLRLIGAACLLPWMGFLAGGVVAWICRQPLNRIIAITLETGIQNVGVAIFALRLSLPQPDNDLSTIGSVCPASFTPIPPLLTLLILTIRRKCKARNQKSEGVQPEEKMGTEEGTAMSTLHG